MKSQMRLWTTLISLALAPAAFAATRSLAANEQGCRLVSGKGPYKSFRIAYSVVDGKPTGDLTLKVSYLSDDFVADTKTKTFRTTEFDGSDGVTAEINGSSSMNVTLGVWDSDFSTAKIALGEDDYGVTAFVDFGSDGPAVRGFYSCTEYPKALSEYMEVGYNPTLVRPGTHRKVEDIVEEAVHEWYPAVEGSSSRSVSYSTTAAAEGSPQMIEIVVTDTGLLDDSVAAQRTTLKINRDTASVVEKKIEYRCQPGRGQQDWGTELCN